MNRPLVPQDWWIKGGRANSETASRVGGVRLRRTKPTTNRLDSRLRGNDRPEASRVGGAWRNPPPTLDLDPWPAPIRKLAALSKPPAWHFQSVPQQRGTVSNTGESYLPFLARTRYTTPRWLRRFAPRVDTGAQLGDTPLLRRVYDQALGPPQADHSRWSGNPDGCWWVSSA